MELFNNIFFNTDKVVENTEIKVTYAGKLFQNNSESVTVHYGFGDQWENAKDIEMQKTELGYQANIPVEQFETLNFCFKNNNNEWDNNNGNNFSFKIEKQQQEEVEPVVEDNVQEVEEKSLCKVGPSWTELFKKTFNNIVNYFSKLFTKNKETVEQQNNL